MTKFGEYLDAQATPAWRDHYVRYKYLKGILKSIVSRNEEARTNARSGFDTPLGRMPPKDLAHLSLTFQEVRPGSKPGETAEGETAFFKVLEEDVEKVRTFVEDSLAALKARVAQLDVDVHQAHREGLPDLASSRAGRDADKFLDSTSSSSDGDDHLSVDIEANPALNSRAIETVENLRDALHAVQDDFLRIEKFANLNTTAVYKILKKHDKLIPATTCCRYYLERLHNQPWIREDHSAVFVVQISDLFALLRGKVTSGGGEAQGSGPKGGAGVQDFVRTTRKYWVATEDVSSVKQAIAEHLPVFLMEREKDPSSQVPADSQMTSSVYLDNVNLGLYHNRITKHPHSIAVRLRWYGTDPENGKVFVERKTHRDSWTGEESVKERFILPPQLVVPFLRGEHTWDDEEQRLRAESKIKAKKGGDPITNAQLDSIKKLFNEVQRAVESKQLQPMLRTVYMRTAFQVPYDASVRCSLDTSLAMVAENPKGGTSCQMSGRWYRDPELAIHRTEQTRFPHAVLEIKLALGAGEEAPSWVTDLVNSGALTEVHKFSKFMHGCAVLFPDVAHEVPYWVDDVSLRQSIQSAADAATGATRQHKPPPQPTRGVPSRRMSHAADAGASLAGSELTHPLLANHNDGGGRLDMIRDQRERAANPSDDVEYPGPFGSAASASAKFFRRARRFLGGHEPSGSDGAPRTVPMRIEPKTFFANERTFLSWLHTAVLIGTIGAGLVSIHLGKSAATRAAGGSVGDGPRGHAGAGLLGASQREGDGGRVLTIVHKHEYRVTFPEGAGANGNFAFSPKVEEGGAGGATTGEVEEAVSRAIVDYFREIGGALADHAATDGAAHALPAVEGHASGRSLLATEAETRETGSSAGLIIALTMLTASVLLSLYATYTFIWRGRMIAKRSTVPFHDPVGPVVMGAIMIVALITLIVLTAANFNAGAVN